MCRRRNGRARPMSRHRCKHPRALGNWLFRGCATRHASASTSTFVPGSRLPAVRRSWPEKCQEMSRPDARNAAASACPRCRSRRLGLWTSAGQDTPDPVARPRAACAGVQADHDHGRQPAHRQGVRPAAWHRRGRGRSERRYAGTGRRAPVRGTPLHRADDAEPPRGGSRSLRDAGSATGGIPRLAPGRGHPATAKLRRGAFLRACSGVSSSAPSSVRIGQSGRASP